jgi:hypothetical protein
MSARLLLLFPALAEFSLYYTLIKYLASLLARSYLFLLKGLVVHVIRVILRGRRSQKLLKFPILQVTRRQERRTVEKKLPVISSLPKSRLRIRNKFK